MTDPTSPPVRPRVLPQDHFRSILAGLITLLTIYGWIDALGRTPDRRALLFQTRLWWVEQIVGFALAIVCIGIVFRKRSLLAPAFWLTVYSMIFDVMRWIFELVERDIRIPVALVLYSLFLWRLWIARKQVAATDDTLVADATR